MTITITACRDEGASGFTIHSNDGLGYLWTPNPETAINYARERLERFVAADLRLRRDGCPQHVAVLAGICPTCHLPADDCCGVEL